jgi:hypothetical protein
VNYISNPTAYYTSHLEIEYPEDTIVNDPYLFYTKDSTYEISAGYQQHSKEISLSALYFFKTNTDKRFSAFAGMGMEVGRAITSYIRWVLKIQFFKKFIKNIKNPLYAFYK